MRGGRNAHGGTVVLGVGLRTVPPQKEPPQIGHMAAEKRGQFRVSAALARKRLMSERDQDMHGQCIVSGTDASGAIVPKGYNRTAHNPEPFAVPGGKMPPTQPTFTTEGKDLLPRS